MKYIFLIFIAAVFTVSVSGCAYNSYYKGYGNGYNRLNEKQISKLNAIMFSYLNIPTAKFSFTAPPREGGRAKGYYSPPAVIKYNFAPKPALTASILTNKARVKSAYKIRTAGNKLIIRISGKETVFINKTFLINEARVTVKKIKYDKGYEVISLKIKNLGKTKTITENFKYSNAGKSFKLKEGEIIQNLTVANKYKKGITLWLKF